MPKATAPHPRPSPGRTLRVLMERGVGEGGWWGEWDVGRIQAQRRGIKPKTETTHDAIPSRKRPMTRYRTGTTHDRIPSRNDV